MERVMGVEPTYQPWEGRILPMNYTRINHFIKYTLFSLFRQEKFIKNGADKKLYNKCENKNSQKTAVL